MEAMTRHEAAGDAGAGADASAAVDAMLYGKDGKGR